MSRLAPQQLSNWLLLFGTCGLVQGCADRSVAAPRAPHEVATVSTQPLATPLLTWLAPLGPSSAEPSTFDASAAPLVEVCAWTGTACSSAPIVRFSTAPAAGVLPLIANTVVGQFEANWNLLSTLLTTRKTYRIRVMQGATELGAISVDVVRGRWALTRADGTLGPLVSAADLPIRFHVPLASVSATIGAAGGRLVLPQGPTIEVPGGGIQGQVTFTLSRLPAAVSTTAAEALRGGRMTDAALSGAIMGSYQLGITIQANTTFDLVKQYSLSVPLSSPLLQGQQLYLQGDFDGVPLWRASTMQNGLATASFPLYGLSDFAAISASHSVVLLGLSAIGLEFPDQLAECGIYPRIDPIQAATGASRYSIVFVHGWLRKVDACHLGHGRSLDNALINGDLPGSAYFETLLAQVSPTLRAEASIYTYTYPTYRAFGDVGLDLKQKLIETFGPDLSGAGEGIILLGHSMGGLVSRTAARLLVSEVPSRAASMGILTLGTPHLGTRAPEDFFAGWALSPFVNVAGQFTPGAQSMVPPIALPSTLDALDVPMIAYGGNLSPGCATSILIPFCSYHVSQHLNPFYNYGNTSYLLCRLASPTDCESDGVVPITSAVPSFLPVAQRRIDGPWANYDHSEMKDAKDGETGLFTQVVADLRTLAAAFPRPVPEVFTATGGNAISMIVVGNDFFNIGRGAGNDFSRLLRTSLLTKVLSEVLPYPSLPMGWSPRRLRGDETHLYWEAGMSFSTPYTIRRIPLTGGQVEIVLDNVLYGADYQLYDQDIYFKESHSEGGYWIDRMPKSGGAITPIVEVSVYSGFTVANGEVFFEHCPSATIYARSLSSGLTRQVGSGLDVTDQCSDELLVVGDMLYISQFHSLGSQILSVPTSGGPLSVRASGLKTAVNLASDGTFLFSRDFTVGEILRFRLSDFAKTVVAARSCGGLTIDATYVYWASEASPAPAPACLDGVSGPIVRLPKN